MRSLLIDDCRRLNVNIIAQNYFDGIWELEHHGPWDKLYLDHDLSNDDESYCKEHRRYMTGYDIMCWLEEHPEHLPVEIVLVTDNPVGRDKMKQVIDNLYPRDEVHGIR